MKTKIYGTLGPSCAEKDVLKEMLELGMTGIRLNLSHISLKDAEEQVKIFHQAEAETGHTAELLIDMQGPEIRVGKFTEAIKLEEGQKVLLVHQGLFSEPSKDTIPAPSDIFPYLTPGRRVLLDDGRILLEIVEMSGECEGKGGHNHVVAQVIRGGILNSRKSLAIEGVNVQGPAVTDQDRENLKLAKAYGVTGIMQPFVRYREDLTELRQAMYECGCVDLSIFAKIENRLGIEHLTDFFETADEIIIARGDLGNSMPLWELPATQKRIAEACKKAGKPFMVVTQMLSSMEKNAVPTRAEVSDIFNAVLDGAASVMVTGETATGAYPKEVIKYMRNTVAEAEKFR